jgi:hypothetical protein
MAGLSAASAGAETPAVPATPSTGILATPAPPLPAEGGSSPVPLPTQSAPQAPPLPPSDSLVSPAAPRVIDTPAPAADLADDGPVSWLVGEPAGRAPDAAGSGESAPSPPAPAVRSGHVPKAAAAPSIDPGEQQAGVALRNMLREFGGCIATLPARDRRVLLLRANLGGWQPRSRSRVAAFLGMSLVGVRAAEGRGVGELRQAHRDGVCGTGSGLEGTTPVASSEIAAGQTSEPGSAPGPQTGAVKASPTAPATAPAAPATTPVAPATTAAASPLAPHRAQGPPLPRWALLPILALLGALLAAVVGWEILKSVRPVGWHRRRALVPRRRYPRLPVVDYAPPPPVPNGQPAEPTPTPLEPRPDQLPRRRRHPVQGVRRPVARRRSGGHA